MKLFNYTLPVAILILIIVILSVALIVVAITITSTTTVTSTSTSTSTVTSTATSTTVISTTVPTTITTTRLSTTTITSTVTTTVNLTITTSTATVISGTTTTVPTTIITTSVQTFPTTLTSTATSIITVTTLTTETTTVTLSGSSSTGAAIATSFVTKGAPNSSQWLILKNVHVLPSSVISNNSGVIPEYNSLSTLNQTKIGLFCTNVVNSACATFTDFSQQGWFYNATVSLLWIHYRESPIGYANVTVVLPSTATTTTSSPQIIHHPNPYLEPLAIVLVFVIASALIYIPFVRKRKRKS